MIEGIPRISVLIICYKQEDVIRRAINSLLVQKEYIYEICVSDDNSPDGTWDVLLEYDRNYPGLFKLHRNNPNVGIFENIEMTWTMPSGDIVYNLSGDDECGVGWFKTVIEYLQEKNINYIKDSFCIYGDYVGKNATGKLTFHSNKLVRSKYDIMSLALRGLICNRSSCASINVVRNYFKVSQGRSHKAEMAQDMQLQWFAKEVYYIPMIGNIYHTGIGVSTNITNQQRTEERKQIVPYMMECLSKYGYRPSRADIRYCRYNIAFKDFLYKKSLYNAFLVIFYLLLSYDFSIGVKSLNLSFIYKRLSRVFKV